jgi:asparagine synthase (glutamine-hydrolysing)
LRFDAAVNNESFGRILYSWFIQPHLPAFLKRLLARRHDNSSSLFPPWINTEFAHRTNLRQHTEAEQKHKFWSWARQVNYQKIIAMGELFQMTAHWLARLAMPQKVEFRHPFFDRRLIEFVLSLPAEQLWHNGYSKYILRESMAGLLPDSIRMRLGKTYYIDVFHHSLRVADTGQISRLLESPLAAKLGFIDSQKLQDALTVYQAGQLNNQIASGLMRVISLEYWLNFHSNKFIS